VRAGWTGAQPMFSFGEYVAQELGYTRIVMVGQDYSFPYNQLGGFLNQDHRVGVGLHDDAGDAVIGELPQQGADLVPPRFGSGHL
jgi:hypothetical protein